MNPYVKSVEVVWNKPRYCFLNERIIWEVAEELSNQNLIVPAWREPVFPEDDEKIIEVFGVENSINFCYTDFQTGQKYDVEYGKQTWRGSFALSAAIKRALEENIPILDPYFLMRLGRNEAKHIFRCKTTPMPLFQERINNLHDVGQTLINTGLGSFKQLFVEADYRVFNNGKGIAERLTTLFKSYQDFSPWRSRTLQFQKRAQLFPMVYYGRALSSNGKLPLIKDPEIIGPITDYKVPKVLRALEILYYKQELADKVDQGEVIPKDSRMEIEIRAQTVQAMWKLLAAINSLRPQDKQITMAELDYAIWSNSGNFKSVLHHRTLTTGY